MSKLHALPPLPVVSVVVSELLVEDVGVVLEVAVHVGDDAAGGEKKASVVLGLNDEQLARVGSSEVRPSPVIGLDTLRRCHISTMPTVEPWSNG